MGHNFANRDDTQHHPAFVGALNQGFKIDIYKVLDTKPTRDICKCLSQAPRRIGLSLKASLIRNWIPVNS